MSESTKRGRPRRGSGERARWRGRDRSVGRGRTAARRSGCRRSARAAAVGAAQRRGGAAWSAQKGWSTRTGTGTAGTPARSPAPVVPAPAWWTTAAVRGNNQSCGRSPTSRMSSPAGPSSAQPDWTTARTPARLTAAATTSWSRSWVGVMLPNPTNTGGGPAAEEVDQLIRGLPSRRCWPATSIRSRAPSRASRRVGGPLPG